MTSLFELSDDLRAADAAMEDAVDEETGLIAADLAQTWELIQGQIDDKLLDWGRWEKNLRSEADACRWESRKLAKRAQAAANKAAFVKMIIEMKLGEGADLEVGFTGRVLKDGSCRLSWRKRTGVDLAPGIDEKTCVGLPEEFIKLTPSPKKRELIDYLKGATDEQRADAAKYARLKTGKAVQIS